MLNIRSCKPWIGSLLVACAALAGCAPKTNVSATGNVPAQYTHLFVSVQGVWFNTSATAVPDDTTWVKFPLTAPVTVDLASSLNGTLNTIASGLAVATGTYAQVRLIPVDAGTALLSTASALGALHNSEVDYLDANGALQQAVLELQNPDKGIGISTTLAIKANTSGSGIGTLGTGSTSSTSSTASSTITDNTTDPFAATVATNGTTSTPTTTGTSSTDGTTTTTVASVVAAVDLDGARDVVPFFYGGIVGLLLNPHMSVYDTSTTGAITGTLTVSALTGVTSTSNTSLDNIQVTAETLSADGSRHEQVNSTAVSSEGTFTLYPLPTSTSSPTSYDLVIHGPGIATIIVKGVTVTVGDPTTTTPVSIGTGITPRAASSYSVNLTTTTPLPAGAIVGFYQTIPVSGEVPYLVEQAPMDPFNRNFASAEPLSSQTIDYGTWSSGSTVTVTTATPSEGAGTYKVSATAPLYTDGALTTTVTAPSTSTTVAMVAVPTLTVASGQTAGTVSFAVTAPAAKYTNGQLIVSKDGAIVATAALDSMLASGSGTISVAGIPSGTTANLYYVSVRTWNTGSRGPAATLNREIYDTALDLRTGTGGSFSLSID